LYTPKKDGKSAKGKRGLTITEKRKRFLAEYAKCGNISGACEKAGIDRVYHYRWMDDPDYQAQFEVAFQCACEELEREAHRRAVTGLLVPQFYQGKKCATIREYSDTLLIFLMKGAMPDKYRDQFKGEIKHTGMISRGPDLSTLSDDQLEHLKAITGGPAVNGRGSEASQAILEPSFDRSGDPETGTEQDS
jgi:hypothetical protein